MTSITVFNNKDIYRNLGENNTQTFSKDTPFQVVYDYCVNNNICGFVQHGAGKWYIKDRPYNKLLNKLNNNTRNYNTTFYLINYT